MSNMVWTTTTGKVFHSDPDCGCLAVVNDPNEVPRESIEGFHRECQRCTGDVSPPSDYDQSLADPGPKLDRGRVSPRSGEDNVHLGQVWTRDGFTQI